MKKGSSTTLIHSGEGQFSHVESLTTPIFETTTFVFENAEAVRRYNEGGSGHFLYSRYENPTVMSAEAKIAAADGAERALLFGSGMAASSTLLMALLNSGDEVVCSAAVYGGTFHLLTDLLSRFGIVTRLVTIDDLACPDTLITDRTRLFWFESPNNPHLRCVDVRRVAAACRARGVTSVIDNTFASPINQRPLEMDIDLSMQSASKYLNGHSDVTAGVVSGSNPLIERVEFARRKLGGILDPQAASHARLLPGAGVTPGPRDREGADDRLRGNGLPRRGRRGGRRVPNLRSPQDYQARGESWRRRERLQSAVSDVAVGAQ
jgi:cystathionine beta-lyase/cystathionine gamma-synthase